MWHGASPYASPTRPGCDFQETVHSDLTGNSEVAKHRCRGDRTGTHKNAPLTPKGREAMVRSVVEGGLSLGRSVRRIGNSLIRRHSAAGRQVTLLTRPPRYLARAVRQPWPSARLPTSLSPACR